MRVAILSCGPSLSLYRPDGCIGTDGSCDHSRDYDCIIAVNRAAAQHSCDWWVVGDAKGFVRVAPVDAPHIAVMRSSALPKDRYGRRFVLQWRDMRLEKAKTPRPKKSFQYSATAAMVLALELNASSVDLYGYDMKGSRYFNGETCRKLRNSRWKKERAIFESVKQWLTDHRIAVKHHIAEAVAA